MPDLIYGDERLHFLCMGEAGPAILFVHGSCGGAAQWRALATLLADEFCCICPDNPGIGGSGPWPDNRIWSPADDEAAFKALLERIGRPVHLVVHSGGGHFAYPLIRDCASRLLSLTLFEPVYFQLLRLAGDPLFAEPEQMARRYRAFADAGQQETALADFVDKWARRQGVWQAMPEPVKAMMRQGASRLYREWDLPWFEHPNTADLAAVQFPAMLFMGSQTLDSMKRVCATVRQSIPGCRFVEVEGAGHMAPFTHAEFVVQSLREHLHAAAGGGSPEQAAN